MFYLLHLDTREKFLDQKIGINATSSLAGHFSQFYMEKYWSRNATICDTNWILNKTTIQYLIGLKNTLDPAVDLLFSDKTADTYNYFVSYFSNVSI